MLGSHKTNIYGPIYKYAESREKGHKLRLQKEQLVFVREVERSLAVFHQAEMNSLHALRGWIGTIIVGRIKLSAAKAGLSIEYGVIAR